MFLLLVLFMIGIHIYPCNICVSVRDFEVRRNPDKYHARGTCYFLRATMVVFHFFLHTPSHHPFASAFEKNTLSDTKSFLLPRHVHALSVSYMLYILVYVCGYVGVWVCVCVLYTYIHKKN